MALGKPGVSSGLSLLALSAETGFAVTAISRTPGVTYSDSFDLQCIIKPHYPARVPVSVTWRFQPVGTVEFQDLVTFTRDGGVQWGDRSSTFRTRTAIEKAESSNNVRLSISRASDTEAGKYQCVAELWRRNYNSSWTRLAERTSNLLEIRVLQPGRHLGVHVLVLAGETCGEGAQGPHRARGLAAFTSQLLTLRNVNSVGSCKNYSPSSDGWLLMSYSIRGLPLRVFCCCSRTI